MKAATQAPKFIPCLVQVAFCIQNLYTEYMNGILALRKQTNVSGSC